MGCYLDVEKKYINFFSDYDLAYHGSNHKRWPPQTVLWANYGRSGKTWSTASPIYLISLLKVLLWSVILVVCRDGDVVPEEPDVFLHIRQGWREVHFFGLGCRNSY